MMTYNDFLRVWRGISLVNIIITEFYKPHMKWIQQRNSKIIDLQDYILLQGLVTYSIISFTRLHMVNNYMMATGTSLYNRASQTDGWGTLFKEEASTNQNKYNILINYEFVGCNQDN